MSDNSRNQQDLDQSVQQDRNSDISGNSRNNQAGPSQNVSTQQDLSSDSDSLDSSSDSDLSRSGDKSSTSRNR